MKTIILAFAIAAIGIYGIAKAAPQTCPGDANGDNVVNILTSTTSAQKLFNGTANGALTLPPGVYEFEAFLYLTTMSATSGNGQFTFGGTATIDRVGYQVVGIDNSSPLNAGTATLSSSVTAGSKASMVTAGTGTGLTATVRGMFRVSAGGTVIPQIALVTAAAAVVKAGSSIRVRRLGESSQTYNGAWS